MLKASSYHDWDMKAIVQQLVGKQIAKKSFLLVSVMRCFIQFVYQWNNVPLRQLLNIKLQLSIQAGIDLTAGLVIIFSSKKSEFL